MTDRLKFDHSVNFSLSPGRKESRMGVRERRGREEQARLGAILLAAENVFAERGYYQARMDDIAEVAELAKGTLYYYFKSKDEIYIHLLEREAKKVHEEIERRISDKASFLEALEETVFFYFEYFEKNAGFLKTFLPCLCGFVRFEEKGLLRKAAEILDDHRDSVRENLKKKLIREKAPFGLEDLLKFIRTLQIGIGLKLLEGKPDEAKAAARFFLDLVRRVMEERTC
jgi:AcrR family transcriptional regulator